MGAVTQGIPAVHAEALKAFGGFAGFFETGTYMGATTLWAAERFTTVHTVEASPVLFERAKGVLGPHVNVIQHLGRSSDVMRRVVPGLSGRWLFWLDAHWSAGDTFGEGEECPLLQEIEIVLSTGSHALLIDDARCFLRPPHPPHDWRQWPNIGDICLTVEKHRKGMFVTVVDDVIFVLPEDLHEKWCEHLRGPEPQPDRTLSKWGGLVNRVFRRSRR